MRFADLFDALSDAEAGGDWPLAASIQAEIDAELAEHIRIFSAANRRPEPPPAGGGEARPGAVA